ncbi:MAG: hypothetical protein PWP52_354 [Bacteroidales bacterium]|nr:hypothetical protein [Bacteroidales bacterium]
MFDNPLYKSTYNDLFVLMEFFGPSVQIGLENPFAGLSIPEKDALRKDSLRRLNEQKVIFYPQLSNIPQLKDKNLVKILEIIAHPKHSLLISSEADQPETRTFHYGDNEDVVSVQQENKNVVINTCSSEQVFQYITSKLDFSENDQSTQRYDPIELDEKLVNQVKELFQKNDMRSALDLLKDAGVKESLVEPLANALCKSDINLGLVVFPNRSRSDSPVKPLGILRKGDYLWTVEASNLDNHTAIIKCVSKQKLLDRIHSILP